jgi:hypothetical protein
MHNPTLSTVIDSARKLKAATYTDKSVGELVAMLIVEIDNANAAQSAPAIVRSQPARQARKSADKSDWKSTPTAASDHAYIRLVACELALMDAYEDAPINGYSTLSDVPTQGDVSEAYNALMPYVKAVKINFGRGSAHYSEAAELVA